MHAVLAGDQIVILGGRNGGSANFFNSTVDTVDLWTFTDKESSDGYWRTSPNLLRQTSAGALVGPLNDRRVVIAGGEGFGKVLERTAIFDPKQMRFLNLGQGPMNRPRHGTQLVRCKNALYAASGSGWQGGTPELDSMEAFALAGETAEQCRERRESDAKDLEDAKNAKYGARQNYKTTPVL